MTKVLYDFIEWGSGSGARAAVTVGPFPVDALVLSSATGRAHYQGDRANAGIRIVLDDGAMPVLADSFEGESSNLTFTAAASTNRILKAGDKVEVSVAGDALGKLQNGPGFEDLRLHVICIDVS